MQGVVDAWSTGLRRGERDRDVERIAVRRALDLVAAFLAQEEEEPAVAESERAFNEDFQLGINLLYGVAAKMSGLVRAEAERQGVEPLDVLRAMEEAVNRGDD